MSVLTSRLLFALTFGQRGSRSGKRVAWGYHSACRGSSPWIAGLLVLSTCLLLTTEAEAARYYICLSHSYRNQFSRLTVQGAPCGRQFSTSGSGPHVEVHFDVTTPGELQAVDARLSGKLAEVEANAQARIAAEISGLGDLPQQRARMEAEIAALRSEVAQLRERLANEKDLASELAVLKRQVSELKSSGSTSDETTDVDVREVLGVILTRGQRRRLKKAGLGAVLLDEP